MSISEHDVTIDRDDPGGAPERDAQSRKSASDEIVAQVRELLREVRRAPPVDAEPTATLIRWGVARAGRYHHLIGWCVGHRQGRISSPVVRWIVGERRAVTQSGSIYEVAGKPGWDAAAMFVLESKLRQLGWTCGRTSKMSPV